MVGVAPRDGAYAYPVRVTSVTVMPTDVTFLPSPGLVTLQLPAAAVTQLPVAPVVHRTTTVAPATGALPVVTDAVTVAVHEPFDAAAAPVSEPTHMSTASGGAHV